MPQTITRLPALAAPIVPTLTDRASYSASRDSRNQLHPIVGRADVEATLRPAGLRAGTMVLLFSSRAAAFAAWEAHAGVGIFTLTDTDVPSASMAYVTQGTSQCELQADSATWQLSIGFQEVLP